MAAFNRASFKMSGGIWFATRGEEPGLDGFADLLPTNLLRGFAASFALEAVDGPASGIVRNCVL